MYIIILCDRYSRLSFCLAYLSYNSEAAYYIWVL